MSGFYFSGDSVSVSSNDDEDNLPYPEALPRSDFLAPDFDASEYLSSLADRHQTLEDLRTDLRERSQGLSKELLDLVNTNYEQFLSLGSDLRGGDEKIEDIRMGLLGLKRGLEEVRSKIGSKGQEVETHLEEKIHLTRQINLGRKILELDARLEELEEKLMMGSLSKAAKEDRWSDSDDDDGLLDTDGHDAVGGTTISKLQRLVQEYKLASRLASSLGKEAPFVAAQQQRLERLRNVLLLDLSTALKAANGSDDMSKAKVVKLLNLYTDIDGTPDALKTLKALKI
jgi:hypothetical protein